MIPSIPELEDYGLDPKTGFMPAEHPLERLEDAYYAPWERIMDKFNGLLLAGRLREAVAKVPPPHIMRTFANGLASHSFNIISRDHCREKTSICHSLVSCSRIHMERINSERRIFDFWPH